MLRHRLVAHRGYQKLYPENTLLALREAIEAGALYIETDIQFSQDFQPVLCHDPFLARVAGMEGQVREKTAAELLQTPAGEPFRLKDRFAGETLASLEQLVALLIEKPEVSVFVELKKEAIAHAGLERSYDIVSTHLTPIRDRVILISFDTDFVARAAKAGTFRAGLVAASWEQIAHGGATAPAPDFIFVDRKKIPAAADLGGFDSLLVIYEVADPDEAVALFERGADMIETFDIGGMIESLSAHSL